MALTKVSTGMLSADVASIDLNIDANTMYIDVSSNRVGIGTSSPAFAVDIKAPSNEQLRIDGTSATDTTLLMDYNGGGATNRVRLLNKAGDFAINVDNTNEAMRIDASGKLLIGDSASHTSDLLQIETPASGGGHGIQIRRNDSNTDQSVGSITFGNNTATDLASISAKTDGATDSGALLFNTSATGGANTERMRIDSSGSVGIGTGATVNRALEIAGNNNGGSKANYIRITDTDTSATAANQQGGIEFYTSDSGNENVTASIENLYAGSGGGSELTFNTAPSGSAGVSERLRIDENGNVGIGTDSPSTELHVLKSGSDADVTIEGTGTGVDARLNLYANSTGVSQIRFGDEADTNPGLLTYAHSDDSMQFRTGNTERMRIDASGNLLVGTTSTSFADQGVIITDGQYVGTMDGSHCATYNRLTSDGEMVRFFKDGAAVGSISAGALSGGINPLAIGHSTSGLWFIPAAQAIAPFNMSTNSAADNSIDWGYSSIRWDDIYATNGTIQTSDRNEKQDIEELSDAEQRVAVAAKGLLRKFRWISSVEENGDNARTHFGIIAQDLQAAFEAEGLDAGDYAMFINSTWTDEETGEERSRMGVRYHELLAFIIAAI